MKREIIFFENHFLDFYDTLNTKVKSKIKYVFELIEQVPQIPKKFLKQLKGSKGLYEIRVKYQTDIFRIFCCLDEGQLVILFNAFQKKSAKTPKTEIKKAELLMKKYFNQKNNNKDG